jgi:hypothetical protein
VAAKAGGHICKGSVRALVVVAVVLNRVLTFDNKKQN